MSHLSIGVADVLLFFVLPVVLLLASMCFRVVAAFKRRTSARDLPKLSRIWILVSGGAAYGVFYFVNNGEIAVAMLAVFVAGAAFGADCVFFYKLLSYAKTGSALSRP